MSYFSCVHLCGCSMLHWCWFLCIATMNLFVFWMHWLNWVLPTAFPPFLRITTWFYSIIWWSGGLVHYNLFVRDVCLLLLLPLEMNPCLFSETRALLHKHDFGSDPGLFVRYKFNHGLWEWVLHTLLHQSQSSGQSHSYCGCLYSINGSFGLYELLHFLD